MNIMMLSRTGRRTLGKTLETFNNANGTWTYLDVCQFGVIFMTYAFLDMLVASEEGALVNTSSVCGFHVPAGVAYSVAKFAVKGFSEGLIMDFAENAPHLSVHCVMPGFISTNIAFKVNNSNVDKIGII